MGMPCFTVSPEEAEALLSAVEADPAIELRLGVAAETVEMAGKRYRAAVPAGARQALTSGTWDATGALLDHFDEVQRVAAQLPYIQGF